MFGGADHDLSKLYVERRDELWRLLVKLRVRGNLNRGQPSETHELFLDTPVFWRFSPGLVPFYSFRTILWCLDRLQHPFGGISIDVDLRCAIAFKIVDESR